MTIRTKIMAVIALLGGFLVLVSLVDGLKALSTYREDLAAMEINEASDLLLTAAGAWAVERGTTAGSLGNPSKATAKQKDTIAAKRKEADAAFQQAMAIIRGQGSGKLENDIRSVETDIRRLNDVRKEVDRVLSAGKAGAAKELQARAFQASTKLIMDSQRLRIHEEQHLGNHVPTHVALAFTIRHNLWVTSEYAGRERGFMAGRISLNEPLTVEQLTRLSNYRGHLENGWSIADLEKTELSSEFQRKMADANRIYFTEFGKMRDAVYKASAEKTDYPVDNVAWFNAATNGIKAILEAQAVAKVDILGQLEAGLSEAFWWMAFDFGLLVLSLIVSGFAVVMLQKRVIGPLHNLHEAMSELAKGNLDVHVIDIEGNDEIGMMSKATYKFKQESRAAERYRSEQQEYRRSVREKQKQELLNLADGFEDAVGNVIDALSSSATELAATTGEVNGIAGRTAGRSSTVREAATEAGSEIRTVSQSVSQVNRAVNDVSIQVNETSKLTSDAANKADYAANKVKALNEASAKIRDIVSLIADIADQTNLLALNATIESARAGEAGKGFAVVANEVKSLANQTQNATDEISAQVTEMLSEIQDSTQAVHAITEAVQQTNKTMTSIATAVQEQAEVTQSVANAAESAAGKITSVVEEINSVAEDATATGGATEQLKMAADDLSMNSNKLTNETEQFIAHIRTSDESGAANDQDSGEALVAAE